MKTSIQSERDRPSEHRYSDSTCVFVFSKMKLLIDVLFIMMQLSGISSYKLFQDRIPNGEQVPHPCNPNHRWLGVGHKNRDGGGVNNAFGLDFKDNNYVCICVKKSFIIIIF